MDKYLSKAELILNPDGSIYHLNLLPEDLADTVITVGDPDRVAEVSKHFDSVELRKGKREFITHTGRIGSHRITVISTGIGTDNIDIVLNELDALVNIDLEKRVAKSACKSLDIIRIGTTGSLQKDLPVDNMLISSHGLGLDALASYYQLNELSPAEDNIAISLTPILVDLPFYLTKASGDLLEKFQDQQQGITLTAPGSYGPQGRMLRAPLKHSELLKKLSDFRYADHRITNLEMETAGIYLLSALLGHKALSVNAVMANRVTGKFSSDPAKTLSKTIELVLSRMF